MKTGIRLKLIVFSLCLVLLVGGSISVYSIYEGRGRILENFQTNALGITALLAQTIVNDLYSLDLRGLRRKLESARLNPDISHTSVLDLEGRMLTDGSQDNAFRDQLSTDAFTKEILLKRDWISRNERAGLKVGGPVFAPDGRRIGHLVVGFTPASTQRTMQNFTTTSLAITAIYLGIGAALGFFIAGSFSRPILSIMQAASKIGKGELNTRLRLHRSDELGVLADSINEMAESLERRTAELARSNEELEQFAYVASHDLQEPLRTISGYTSLLAKRYKGKLDKDADEFIGFAVEGAKRMQGLIQDLLAYSRVGSQGKEFAPTDCEAVLAQTLRSLKFAAQEAAATIIHDKLPIVMGDETQLAQLFQNLIGNGIKYRNGNRPEIHISCKREDGKCQFSVSDNGIGIDPKYAEKIFVIFQRLHTREEYAGSGIGLAVCKKIVERHGGKIWVESEPGQGSTFFFTLADRGGSRV